MNTLPSDIPSGDLCCNSHHHHHHHHPSTTAVDGIFMETSSQTPRFAIAVQLAWLHSAHSGRAPEYERWFFICPIKMTSKLETLFLWSKRERCFSPIDPLKRCMVYPVDVLQPIQLDDFKKKTFKHTLNSILLRKRHSTSKSPDNRHDLATVQFELWVKEFLWHKDP